MAVVRGATALASLAIAAPAAAIIERIVGERIAGRQLLIATIEGLEFQIGWHAVSATKTMLHAGLRSAGDTATALTIVRRVRTDIEGALAA